MGCASIIEVGENGLYCIVLYLQPVLNPKSYDGARVLEASGRPMLVIGGENGGKWLCVDDEGRPILK